MTAQTPDIEQLLADEHARRQPPKRLPPLAAMTREFHAFGEDRYRMVVAEIGVTLEVDRLRREHHELMGELSAHCELPGARTVDGSLSIAGLNLSSAMARQYRAKLLSDRANTPGFDWAGLIEEFCQRVLQADRAGQPAVDLRQIERPNPKEDMIEVDGLALPKHHPSILFGDGGTGKSYLALYLAGRMAEKGVSVMLADWELCGDDHRDRLERLFPDGMPRILYARCEKPLVFEADRLRRVVKENGIQFSVFDSIAFASDGPPEAAEVAGRYFRAVRQIGGGSLHVAHVTNGENADTRAREDAAIALLLSGKSINEVCSGAKISRSSFWRLRKNAEFQERFEAARAAAFEAAVNKLHDSATLFVQTLSDVCTDPKSRDSAKATAARSGLDSLFRVKEIFDLTERVRKLEQAAVEEQK